MDHTELIKYVCRNDLSDILKLLLIHYKIHIKDTLSDKLIYYSCENGLLNTLNVLIVDAKLPIKDNHKVLTLFVTNFYKTNKDSNLDYLYDIVPIILGKTLLKYVYHDLWEIPECWRSDINCDCNKCSNYNKVHKDINNDNQLAISLMEYLLLKIMNNIYKSQRSVHLYINLGRIFSSIIYYYKDNMNHYIDLLKLTFLIYKTTEDHFIVYKSVMCY
jgi:hypothetical protein